MIDRLLRIFNLRRIPQQPPDEVTGRRGFLRTFSGVAVDEFDALKNDVVWGCANYLSKTVAQLPWQVMRPRRDGRGADYVTSTAATMLDQRANPEMSAFNFRRLMVLSATIWGNGCAEIVRDAAGRAAEMYWLEPWRTEPDRINGELGVWYQPLNGARVWIPYRDVFHVTGFGYGVWGVSIIEYAAQTIGWRKATQLFGQTYFGEGINPSSILTPKEALTPEAFKIWKAEAEKQYMGPDKKRTIFLGATSEMTKLAIQPDESQFVETLQHQIPMICRFFGVPPTKVSDNAQFKYQNPEHQSIETVTDTIVPLCKQFEQEADYKLFGANREKLFTKLKTQGLMRGDTAARGTYYKERFLTGSMTPNQIRDYEDENPGPAELDKYYMQSQMATAEEINKRLTEKSDAGVSNDVDEAAGGEPAPERRVLNGADKHAH